jgi:hypothetical protein
MPEHLVAKLSSVRNPEQWWSSPARRPLFMYDMSGAGRMLIHEETAHLKGQVVNRQTFQVVKMEIIDQR